MPHAVCVADRPVEMEIEDACRDRRVVSECRWEDRGDEKGIGRGGREVMGQNLAANFTGGYSNGPMLQAVRSEEL